MPTLNWIGKEAVVNHHLQVPFHLLKDVPELACGEPGGAIFISIDDNEVHHLRSLMDVISGEQNFVACIEWQKIYTVKNSARYLSEMHDHLLFYTKRKDSFARNLRPRDAETDEDYDNSDDDPRGPWISNALQSRNFYSKGIYSVTCPGGRVIEGPPAGTYWRLAETKFWKLDGDKRVWWGKDSNGIPRIKKFLSEAKGGVVPTTWWTYQFAGSNSTAKMQLRSILQGNELFITPKPIELIKRILEIASGPDSLILDSFAGSGTTAHAVVDLNKKDGGSRRFILVEIEPSVARNVTAERVRRVINGYSGARGQRVEGLGGAFRYCELGEPLFDENGKIRDTVTFAELARHVFFSETGEPLPRERVKKSPFLGSCRGVGIYLLYNGILRDKSANGGNVLTRAVLAELPAFDGQKVIYCAGCLLGKDRLQQERIIVRQTPYEIKVS